jgi:condensin complex subunit 1
VRSNCIIALGDLAFRFPNVLEPWTEHMYARLSDKDRKVRKNAVLVLTHLILNDMVKVFLFPYTFRIVSNNFTI